MDFKILFCLSIILCCAGIRVAASDEFKVYWNIPTFMCKKYNISFDKLSEQYQIVQNQKDSFRGEQISILYDPGLFPAILQNSSSKEFVYRNHGVPQMGNLSEHLELLTKQVIELIPNSDFSGFAIVDFESWRPIYRQNFGTLKPYKTLSMQLEQKNHPRWPKKKIEKEAKLNFEAGGKTFMLETLRTVKKIRPNAKWGYYAFPYCFNGNGINADKCAKGVEDENNMIQWMFQSSDVIYPSVYLQESLPQENRIPMVKGRVQEAIRIANMIRRNNKLQVLVYHRYKYTDTLRYIDTMESFNVLNEIKQQGANGVILWGSSYDLNSRVKCQQFKTYFEGKLGPVIRWLN